MYVFWVRDQLQWRVVKIFPNLVKQIPVIHTFIIFVELHLPHWNLSQQTRQVLNYVVKFQMIPRLYFSVIFDHNEYSFLHHDYSLWSYMRIMSTHFCIMTSHFGHFLGHNDHLIFPENCHDYSLSPNNQPS